jgi:hypothetical protein
MERPTEIMRMLEVTADRVRPQKYINPASLLNLLGRDGITATNKIKQNLY